MMVAEEVRFKGESTTFTVNTVGQPSKEVFLCISQNTTSRDIKRIQGPNKIDKI